MGSNGSAKDIMTSGSEEAMSSDATVEIKIKTLDSQTYTLRVDKCVPVPALKEQVATVTGVLSDRQRLICRGRVLKDDQLLSAYHVEDGHTLHLVVREPVLPTPQAADPASSEDQAQGNQGRPSVVVGTFNLSEPGNGGFPDFGRIVSAVLGSLGIANPGSGSEAVNMPGHVSEGVHGLSDLRNSERQQGDSAATNGHSIPPNAAFQLPNDVPLDPLNPPVIPDALSTLSQYLLRMRHEFNTNVRGQSNAQPVAGHGSDALDSNSASHSSIGHGGLPTPSSLAEVTRSTNQLLIEQAGECLMQLTRQLEDNSNVTDPLGRTRIQANAIRYGSLLQNLGAFLLELGRTTMTLRMGQTPAEAVVNAGPAVYISTSGPNPIMVQPLPFQPGTSFGSVPLGNSQPVPGLSVGSGLRPRSIDIRIRTGSLVSSAFVNQREAAGGEPLGQADPASNGNGNSTQPTTTRTTTVRMVPIRAVVAAVPVVHAPSDPSRGSFGMLRQAARSQGVDTANSTGPGNQTSGTSNPANVGAGQQAVPDVSSQQPNIEVQVEASTPSGMQNIENLPPELRSSIDRFLRTFFNGEQSSGTEFIFQGMGANPASVNAVPTQGMGTNSASGNVETAQEGAASAEASDEGIFLANVLRQIMPIVTQNINGSDDMSSQGVGDGTSTAPRNLERGSSSQRPGSPPSSPSAKRQKRE